MTESIEREISIEGTVSFCVLEDDAKDNCYANLTIAAITTTEQRTLMLDDVKSWQSHASAKSRSRVIVRA